MRLADEFNLQTSCRLAPGDQHKSELTSQDVVGQIELVREAAEKIGRQIVDALGRYTELGISRVYLCAPTNMSSLAGNFELFAAEVFPQLVAL